MAEGPPEVEATGVSLVQSHSGLIETVVFSPDGKYIASGSWDNTVKLWDATTGNYQKTLEGHSKSVLAIAFSPDGKRVASGSWDNTVKLWDTTTGNCQKTLEGHLGAVVGIAFSPDGRHVASGSRDSTVKLWDATTGDAKMLGHSGSVTAVAFSPDGKHVASGSWDKTVKLWDATTGKCQETLEGHSQSVTAVTFSPDGKHLASSSDDDTVKLWDVFKALGPSKILENTLNWRRRSRFQEEIKTRDTVTSVRYSDDGEKIVTNFGAFTVNNVESEASYDRGSTSLEELWLDDRSWLCYGKMRLLLLGSASVVACYHIIGGHVGLGLSNGHIFALDIDRRILAEEMENLI